MAEQQRTYTVRGTAPLIMHQVIHFIDPMSPYRGRFKELSQRKEKQRTEADTSELNRLEWLMSIYQNGDALIIPGVNIEAVIRDGAKETRDGKSILSGLYVPEDPEILASGCRIMVKDLDDHWKAQRYVDKRVVSGNGKPGGPKILRTRGIVKDWSLTFTAVYDDSVVDKLDRHVETAGRLKGLCDYRPRYGRFEVVEAA